MGVKNYTIERKSVSQRIAMIDFWNQETKGFSIIQKLIIGSLLMLFLCPFVYFILTLSLNQ